MYAKLEKHLKDTVDSFRHSVSQKYCAGHLNFTCCGYKELMNFLATEVLAKVADFWIMRLLQEMRRVKMHVADC